MRLALAASITLLFACDPHRPAARPHVHAARAATGAPLTPEVAPTLPEPEALADELASHETLADCHTRVRSSITADVAELLGELGYDAAPDDVCGALDAVRRGDVAACDALSVSAVRRGCRRRVAIAHGTPDACPDDAVVPGREPTCLAWAARDAGLCRGAAAADATRCGAVLANDAGRCRDAVDGEACRRDVRRFGSLLAAATATRSAASDVVPTFTLTLHGRALNVDADATPTVARGVVVTHCGGLATFALGRADRDDGLPYFVQVATPVLVVSTAPGADGARDPIPLGGPGARASLAVVLPHAQSVTSDLGAAAVVRHQPLALTRGALLAGTVEGSLPGHGETLQVSGAFRTFVRDVVERSPPCDR